MATLTTLVQQTMAKLATLEVVDADNVTAPMYVRMWNNQPQKKDEGKGYVYRTPACFVEVLNPADFKWIGEGYRAANIVIRLRIEHQFYNIDGTFEQDLRILDLRDVVIGLMKSFKPDGCSTYAITTEEQDYDHDNTNIYIIDLVTHFVDEAGKRVYTFGQATSVDTGITKAFNIT